jgi:hypothetical protein
MAPTATPNTPASPALTSALETAQAIERLLVAQRGEHSPENFAWFEACNECLDHTRPVIHVLRQLAAPGNPTAYKSLKSAVAASKRLIDSLYNHSPMTGNEKHALTEIMPDCVELNLKLNMLSDQNYTQPYQCTLK